MVLQIFRPPSDNELLQDCKLGDINDAISLEYEKYFCGAGTFTLELSPASPFAGAIEVNSLIYCREDDICWVVKNIKTTSEKVTVTGYDLNGLLLDRLTLPTEDGEAGTEGKDAVSGSTEACVKHFVEYNLISSEMPERNIPRLVAAENMDRGIAQDSYLASKECLEDVVRTMCGGAGLGYRIRLDLTQSTSEPIFIFDVMEQCDRSADQDERNRVIFSEGMRNISNIERELGITADKNALWCEVGGLDGFVNSGENIPAGWARREEYVSLSVTDPYNQEFVDEAAQKEMSDKFASTDSLTVEAGNPLEYGVVYDVGDIVTVYDREKSAQLNSVISAVTVKRTATEHTVKLTLGESKPKLLDGYAKKTDLLAKNQRAYPVAQASTAGAITTYEYLTDSSVKFNDTTYTIEKNEAGLISKITDSLGNSLKPVVSGEITDIVLHNAALWGAVMARGIGKVPEVEMPDMTGIRYYYIPETKALSEGLWKNLFAEELSDRGDMTISEGAEEIGHAVNLRDNQYGTVETADTVRTIYCLAKLNSIDDRSMGFIFRRSNNNNINVGVRFYHEQYYYDLIGYAGAGWQYSIDTRYNVSSSDRCRLYSINGGNGYSMVGFSENSEEYLKNNFSEPKDFLDYHIYAVTSKKRQNTESSALDFYFYIDGNYIGYVTFVANIGTTYHLNYTIDQFNSLNISYLAYAMGTGDTYHTPEMVKANSEWLLKKARGDWKD